MIKLISLASNVPRRAAYFFQTRAIKIRVSKFGLQWLAENQDRWVPDYILRSVKTIHVCAGSSAPPTSLIENGFDSPDLVGITN
jgi:hypothetical protein